MLRATAPVIRDVIARRVSSSVALPATTSSVAAARAFSSLRQTSALLTTVSNNNNNTQKTSSICNGLKTTSTLLSSSSGYGSAVEGLRRYYSSVAEELAVPLDTFERRHVGPSEEETKEMLSVLGVQSLEELTEKIVPKEIQLNRFLNLTGGAKIRGEAELLQEFKQLVSQNKQLKSFLGLGYYNTIIPPVILRNVLENPMWYTPYTPYQGEIAQGRLESLLNFQTMVGDLTGLPYSNCSLLDEATAAAEAMTLCFSHLKNENKNIFFVAADLFPQTIAVIKTRAAPLGIQVVVDNPKTFDFAKYGESLVGAIIQYPSNIDGEIVDHSEFIQKVHSHKALVIAATDLLACTVIKPPGEIGADIAVGSAQRFGVPVNYGGPHAGFLAVKDMTLVRKLPGRIIGVSKDSRGKPVFRMALQAREQHIRREKATSNICTAQALLANIAAFYAVYHGPKGLRDIANRVHDFARVFAEGVGSLGYLIQSNNFFDTVTVVTGNQDTIIEAACERGINLRKSSHGVSVSFDETATIDDLVSILNSFAGEEKFSVSNLPNVASESPVLSTYKRASPYLTHPIFNSFHSETEMLRYIFRLASKDVGLNVSMIPLGSCTMKLNATSEMIPVTWPEIANIHPFVPVDQAAGYQEMFRRLEADLAEITGFDKTSLQPNAGSQGEYAGLLAIRGYFQAKGQFNRNICLIPASAHGTNPASAVMAGMKVVVVKCSEEGFLDLEDLSAKAKEHSANLAALMVTYPSTYGVFEGGIKEACRIVHDFGGQVYMDGANMNAQVGLCRPGDIGADVCHLNLHKTFCIPHGGGGPGVGPICVKSHLAPYLPTTDLLTEENATSGPVSAAPYGSAAILPITYMYINLMGAKGLKKATQTAILNANYMKKRLEAYYPAAFHHNGYVAHEFIIDTRQFAPVNITPEDIAKRLMDYNFHAPTMSWPVPGTLMIEPTESESKEELDRLIDALISIRQEIKEIEEGKYPKDNNVLKNAPHTADVLLSDNWNRPYPREKAAYPVAWIRNRKFWPSVGRIDNVGGDRHLVCSCPPLSDYE